MARLRPDAAEETKAGDSCPQRDEAEWEEAGESDGCPVAPQED